MTNALRDLLADYAEDAKAYDVREQALKIGRRRRRVRRGLPAAAVALLTVTAVAVAQLSTTPLQPNPTLSNPPAPQTTTPYVPPNLPSFPAAVVTDYNPAELPTDSGVGLAMMVHYLHPDGWRVIMRDGTTYRVEPPGIAPETDRSFSLSPDDRWLVTSHRVGTEMTLRDLTTTTVVRLTTNRVPGVWSPDGRWLVLGNRREPDTAAPKGPGIIELVDLAASPPVVTGVDMSPDCGYCAIVGVRANGDLVLSGSGRDHLGVVVVENPRTHESRRIAFDLASRVTPTELAQLQAWADLSGLLGRGNQIDLMPDGTAFVPLPVPVPGSTSVDGPFLRYDRLVLDLDQGTVRQRLRLPDGHPIPDNPRGDWENWGLINIYAEGWLMAHSNTQRLLAWELYDPKTGTLTEVTNLRGLSSAKD